MQTAGGIYNRRLIRGSKKISRHSWGIAIDINVAYNQFLVKPPSTFDVKNMRVFTKDHPIVSLFQRYDFEWGGNWKNHPDGMHFEFANNIMELKKT